MAHLIPFVELTGGTEGVRSTVIQGETYMSARDIIQLVTKKDRVFSSKLWLKFYRKTLKKTVDPFLMSFQFPGGGQTPGPVLSLPGAQKLVEQLSAYMSKAKRDKVLDIMTRCIQGGSSAVQGQEEPEEMEEEPEVISHLQLKEVAFDEFKDGAIVHVLMEKPPLIHAIDLAMVVTGKDKRQAAKAIRDIPSDMFDLGGKIHPRSLFLPSGTKTVKFVTYEDSLQLIMALGGKQANLVKTQFAKILTRYFAGDATMHGELEANAASSSPLNFLARESETFGSKRVHSNDSFDERQLEVAKKTRLELEKSVEVSNTLGTNLSQQGPDVTLMLEAYEKILSIQRDIAEAQLSVETAKQQTHAVDMQCTKEKVSIELEFKEELARRDLSQKEELAKFELIQKEELAKRLTADREAELAFIAQKRQVMEGPLQLGHQAAPTPAPIEVVAQVPQPKTIRDIAKEDYFWPNLSDYEREDLLRKASAYVSHLPVVPMPDKVKEINSARFLMEVNAYNLPDHSAVHGAVRRAYGDLVRKNPRGKQDGMRQTGLCGWLKPNT